MDISQPASIYRWIIAAISLVVFKVAVDKVLSLRRAFAKIKDSPGRQALWIDNFSPLALFLGNTFPRPGMGGYIDAKFSLYRKFAATTFASVNISNAQLFFWLADAEALRIVTSDRHTFPKDVPRYELISIYGGHVVGLEGSDWKRHRSVTMSAFNEENVALVWSETMRVLHEWFEQLDSIGPDIPVDVVKPLSQITLLVIVSAAFGKQVSLTLDPLDEPPPGCKLTFHSAVANCMERLLLKALIPNWFYRFSSFIKMPYLSSSVLFTQLVFDDLRSHMLDIIATARAEVLSGKRPGAQGAALLRNLVEANMNQEGDKKQLTDDELLSNVFIFLLAGHETSAHSLSFVFVLLALHPDCQQKLYKEVTRVWPADVSFSQLTMNHKQYMDKLEYTMACIRESQRVMPVTPRIPKIVSTDTVLPSTCFVPGRDGSPSIETGSIPMAIPAGSMIVMDVWAMHLNPLYWGEDAEEYRPERFFDTESYQWPRHAYLPFSGGARSCMGQRFAMAEMVGIVASVVRRYRILVPDDLANKPFDEQKRALMAWTSGVTSTPLNARLKLSRRV